MLMALSFSLSLILNSLRPCSNDDGDDDDDDDGGGDRDLNDDTEIVKSNRINNNIGSSPTK